DYRLNGHIGTENKFSFKYGVAAARIKFPKAEGQHGAFWLQPQTRVATSVNPKLTGAEIDIIESFGQTSGPKNALGLTSFTYHWKKRGSKIVPVKTGKWLKNTDDRSEERRVGKESRSRWAPYDEKKKKSHKRHEEQRET